MRVSIIIPVFNAERYLERCIESFQHQDLPAEEFEVLFVDNNSQDRSTEMISRFRTKHALVAGKKHREPMRPATAD